MPIGRPSTYNEEIAAEICERIATTPRGLDFICAQADHLPSAATVHNWLNAHAEFLESYKRARERQADLIFDECLEIADDSSLDVITVERDDGSSYDRTDTERVARSKLRVETRLRMAGKLAPKKYGDRQIIAGDKDAPLEVKDVSDLERAKAIAALIAKAKG